MKKKNIFILIIMFVLKENLFLASQQNNINTYILEGIKETSNFEFEKGHSYFHKIYLEDKNNPASYFYFAWLLSRMQDYYAKKDYNEIIRYLNYANSLADKRIKKNEKDVEALFYKAAINGLTAYIEGLKESWWNVAMRGKEMRNYAKRILEIQPDNPDALYFIGFYDYFADTLPSIQKFFRTLLFIPGGNKKRGLEELQIASQQGYFTKLEADRTLLIIYIFYEKNCIEGQKLAYSLIEKFPKNPFFRYSLSKCFYYEQQWQLSADALKELPSQYSYLKRYGPSPLIYEIEYWLARSYLHLNQYQDATNYFLEILSEKPEDPPWLIQWTYISLGQAYDLQGDTEKAISSFKKALKIKNYKQAHSKILKRIERNELLSLYETDY